jgi:hypothetical protein
MRYFGAMSNPIQVWFDALPEEWQERAQEVREILLDAAPNMKEEWKYKLPFYCNGRWMCYFSLQKSRLILGFVEGAHLSDPHGLFATTDHKQIRHVIFEPTPAKLNGRALRAHLGSCNAQRGALGKAKTGQALMTTTRASA